MLNTAFAPWPSFTEEEAQAVAAVLRSNRVNYWTGDECRAFEREFADWSESGHAIALANGTVALDLALHGLGIGAVNGGDASDEVVVTPRTFLASVSCVVNAGAIPVFADVDRDSGNISADTIAPVLTPRTRGAIIVHLAGWPADMDPIMELATKHDFKVIEDCAQAHGALYKGRSVGAIGHVGAWSFCQAVYERAHPPGFRWLHEGFGTNWRMIEMQAAIGRIQLQRMAGWTAARTRNADVLGEALARFAGVDGIVRLPAPADAASRHAQYKFYAYVRPDRLTLDWNRDRIVAEIVARGVPCFQGSCSEVYLEKAFDGTGWRPAQRLPAARELGETSLMWLVHPGLTEAQMRLTTQAIDEVLAAASGYQGG